jgi:hypothetical protein
MAAHKFLTVAALVLLVAAANAQNTTQAPQKVRAIACAGSAALDGCAPGCSWGGLDLL